MRVIGVTGGIGSGKSTVSGILERLGANVIDADRIAKEIAGEGGRMLLELTRQFGSSIVDESGKLDRRKLGDIVFGDPEKVKVLNGITHKYIIDEMTKRLDKLKAQANADVIVMDVPIPVEHGFLDQVDEVWVVTADMDERIRRVVKRSGLTPDEALSRINSQKNDEEYLKVSDRIICNSGTIEQLERTVVELYNKLRQGDVIG